MRTVVDAWAPGLPADRATAIARVAGGRLDRAERLLDAAAAERRDELLTIARSVYADPSFQPAAAAERVLTLVGAGAEEAKERVDKELEWLDLPGP